MAAVTVPCLWYVFVGCRRSSDSQYRSPCTISVRYRVLSVDFPHRSTAFRYANNKTKTQPPCVIQNCLCLSNWWPNKPFFVIQNCYFKGLDFCCNEFTWVWSVDVLWSASAERAGESCEMPQNCQTQVCRILNTDWLVQGFQLNRQPPWVINPGWTAQLFTITATQFSLEQLIRQQCNSWLL